MNDAGLFLQNVDCKKDSPTLNPYFGQPFELCLWIVSFEGFYGREDHLLQDIEIDIIQLFDVEA